MKEMVYEKIDKYEILDIGTYKGKDYVIVNIAGNHPCAYVQSDIDYYEWESPAHWGFTFYNTLYHIASSNEEYRNFLDRYFMGWDYNHYGDYNLYIKKGKKWSTEEILENVKEVIDWILEKEGVM